MVNPRILVALSACAMLLAGCGGNPPGPAASGPPPADPVSAGTGHAGGSPAAAPVSAAEVCKYLTLDQATQALQYTGELQSMARSIAGSFAECDYRVPGDDENAVAVSVSPGTAAYDETKAIGESDCISAGVGDESFYCPKALLAQVNFIKSGKSVSVSCGSSLQLEKKAGDPVQAALVLAKIVANEL